MYTQCELLERGDKMNIELMAKKLVALRGDKSREEVARDNGISVSALAMYETGKRVPRDEIKLSLARYYGSSVEEIFFAS
jgi:putative transcriptional regulator